MNEFLEVPEGRRRLLCEQAQDRLGLPPAAIMNRLSICALCGDPVENRYLDEKDRCGSCSGAS